MDDAQCDLYLQQYFAEGTEFVLSTRLPDAEQCVAVFACEEKRQSEILRKLRMFVSKYTEYTVAVGYFVDSLSGVYNSSRLAQIAMERCLVEQNRYSRLVSDIRTFCIRNLSDNTLGGQMISDRFHLSVTYLNQLFKQELSVTIKQYISEMRMERARELLTQTYDTVDEIAAKCGYSNGNYFAKAFRENQHMSPTDYRKQMEKRYEKEPRT